MIRGEVWTSCSAGCDEDQLEIPGTPPLVAKGTEWSPEHWDSPREVREPLEGDRVVPLESAAAREECLGKTQLSFKFVGVEDGERS